MKILLLNPNTSQSVTDRIANAAMGVAGAHTRHRDRPARRDCVEAAVKQAETLVALNPRKAVQGTFARPGAKPCIGIGEPLARWINHE